VLESEELVKACIDSGAVYSHELMFWSTIHCLHYLRFHLFVVFAPREETKQWFKNVESYGVQ